MRVHINNLPRVVLDPNTLAFEIGHIVKSAPKLRLEDDVIVYETVERPNLVISNARPVFFHAFTTGLNLYETHGSEDDIVVYNPRDPKESSQWPKEVFYATATQGFALYKAYDDRTSNLTHFQPKPSYRKLDDAEGDVWLDIHVEFRAGPGETVIGQRRRINKNTGEIEYGQTFVQPLDVAMESYAQLGKAIETVLNPQPDPNRVVPLSIKRSSEGG